MKLYDVPRNTWIVVTLVDGSKLRLHFHHIDGMYSYCVTEKGDVVHVDATTDVEIVQ